MRHWRSYGNDPLPTGAEALDEPFPRSRPGSCASPASAAGRSACSTRRTPAPRSAPCGSATSSTRCATTAAAAGGRTLTGIEGVRSRPVQKIVLRGEP